MGKESQRFFQRQKGKVTDLQGSNEQQQGKNFMKRIHWMFLVFLFHYRICAGCGGREVVKIIIWDNPWPHSGVIGEVSYKFNIQTGQSFFKIFRKFLIRSEGVEMGSLGSVWEVNSFLRLLCSPHGLMEFRFRYVGQTKPGPGRASYWGCRGLSLRGLNITSRALLPYNTNYRWPNSQNVL